MTPHQDIPQLISEGKKIEAIKAYRERYGVGLKEAKDAIDAAAEGRPLPVPPSGTSPPVGSDPLLWGEIDQNLRQGNKIEAIRLYRERSGLGLKEAKDVIDDRQKSQPELNVKSGCFIATAAYGSPMAAEVETLRRFRDGVLLTRAGGRACIHAYYRLSPPVARWVARSPALRGGVRLLLAPVVRLLRRR